MLIPDESSLIYTTDREEWRRWLSNNYRTVVEVWLVFYRKGTDKPRIAYSGWIDSNEILIF